MSWYAHLILLRNMLYFEYKYDVLSLIHHKHTHLLLFYTNLHLEHMLIVSFHFSLDALCESSLFIEILLQIHVCAHFILELFWQLELLPPLLERDHGLGPRNWNLMDYDHY